MIRPSKLNMAAKFVVNFIFLRGIVGGNDVQNLKLSFLYRNIRYIVFIIP